MLYLVRHGSTDQQTLRAPGDMRPATHDEWLLDYGLSAQGRGEAELLRQRFSRILTADRYLSSPRRRAQETARIAVPEAKVEVDDRLHEWFVDESGADLRARARWLLDASASGLVVAFTHGGFIRAVLAALTVGKDVARFEPTFHDLRRMLHIWNTSITIIAPGLGGLEVVGVNLCQSVEELAGRA